MTFFITSGFQQRNVLYRKPSESVKKCQYCGLTVWFVFDNYKQANEDLNITYCEFAAYPRFRKDVILLLYCKEPEYITCLRLKRADFLGTKVCEADDL
jgi:hypothetical protein